MKILVLSASTGGGHMKAAEALKTFFDKKDNINIKVVDTLEYINPILNKTITESYLYMAKKAPKMFGIIYNSSNKESKFSDMITSLNKLFSKKLLNLINDFSADIIISTHMFPTTMISNLKEKNKINIPLICIVTDYAPHRTWINKNVDAYIVADDKMTLEMKNMGADPNRIYPFGIPINPSFFIKQNKNKTLREIGLDPKIPTILIMAGSFGVTNIIEIYNKITSIDVDFQIVVITGKNKRLYKVFRKRISKNSSTLSNKKIHISSSLLLNHKVKFHSKRLSKIIKKIRIKKHNYYSKETRLIYFTDKVYSYMQAADLIITKPGGLTVSEALASNLPMAVFDAIPGQEEENAEFLVKNNMAVNIGKGSNCKNIIENLLKNKKDLFDMKRSCKSFDKSKSNESIYNLIKTLIK